MIDKQETVQPPRTAQEIRDFIGSNANSMRFVNAPKDENDFRGFLDCEASDSDTYSVSAHDLLSSIDEWFSDDVSAIAQPVERKPLTLDQLSDLVPGTVRGSWSDFVCIARAIQGAE